MLESHAELKSWISTLLRVNPRSVQRYHSRDYANALGDVIALLEELLAGGEATAVVSLAEHTIARLDRGMSHVDDSRGFLIGPIEELKAIHHAACVAGRPDPLTLGKRLAKIALRSDWEWFLDAPSRYADVLGEAGLAALRAVIDRERPATPTEADMRSRPGGEHRQFVAQYLREEIARARGSVDELIEAMALDCSSAYRYVLIATELEAAERGADALSWAERGISRFGPDRDGRLRACAVSGYLRAGRPETALELVERALELQPTAEVYAELRAVAGALPDWPQRRELALGQLRAARRGGGRGFGHAEIVGALLAEGEAQAALQEARTGGCPRWLWIALADALGSAAPEDACDIYRRFVGESLGRGGYESAYREAIPLLTSMRTVLSAHGRQEEFDVYLANIRVDNRRRPKLLSLIDAAGL